MAKKYQVLKNGKIISSNVPGKFAGWRPGKVFGRLDCKSGSRMKKENRVFFLTWKDAIDEGYRPCRNCKPTPEDEYVKPGRFEIKDGWFKAEFVTPEFIRGGRKKKDMKTLRIQYANVTEDQASKYFEEEAKKLNMVLRRVDRTIYYRPVRARGFKS